MDPNANLREQEDILTQVGPVDCYERARLKKLRIALREWLDNGGFAPIWDNYPKAHRYFDAFLVRRTP